jgi:Holliday junction resolvasome RuvABC endonuclease subunit
LKLLALDQASHITGYSVFDNKDLIAYGKFELKDEDLGKRLVKYRKKIEELIEKYDIEEVAFEDIQMQS